jgi:ATP-binding cassette subfamily B (MDR/TAP) protein 1
MANDTKRVFRYADGKSWALNIVAFVAAIAAGTLLPLMNLFFGRLCTSSNLKRRLTQAR